MKSDEEPPLSAIDVAYDFIDGADDDWTREELLKALARAGFSLGNEEALDDILEAVSERFKFESILSEAIGMFLQRNSFRDLPHAAEQMDCTIEEVVEVAATEAGLFGRSH